MAVNDIKVKFPTTEVYTTSRNLPSGTANSIHAGEPSKAVDAAAASPYLGTIAPMVDGDGTTSQRFTGIAKNESTDTASVAGTVDVIYPFPGIIYTASAKTASNANTLALVDALKSKRVVFDLTASKWTIDTAAADAVVNCVVIVGGNFQTQTIDFVYANHGTYLNFSISA